jgi:uncharacterized protein YkwD
MKMIKPTTLIMGAIISTAFVASSCSTSSNLTQVSAPTSRDQVIAKRVFSLINAERAKVGRPPLRGSGPLNTMAQKHSKFQATSQLSDGKPSHFGAQNRAQFANLKYGIENVGEMIYAVPVSDPDPAGTAVNAWESSGEHKRYINQSWTLTGIGVSRGRGQIYITMLVGVRSGGVPRSMRPGGWH